MIEKPLITERVEFTFLFIVGISVFLLLSITAFMIFAVIRYSRKRNVTPKDIESNTVLEIIWTVVPVILVLFMFYYGWIGFKTARNVPEGAMVVKVTARMWSWLFEYGNGKRSDVLQVPVGKPVKLELSSEDVIHSLFIPAFRVKEDAVPGRKTYLWFEAPKPGSYDILCAEYCGTGHSAMLAKVVVKPEAEFTKWYEGVGTPVAEIAALPVTAGAELIKTKGCAVCHTTDGSPSVGPTFKGIFGKKTKVVTNGREKEITADEDYLLKSIMDPEADLVKDFPPVMPPQKDLLTDQEIQAIIAYLKTLK